MIEQAGTKRCSVVAPLRGTECEREAQRGRGTERKKERERDRKREREIERERERERERVIGMIQNSNMLSLAKIKNKTPVCS